MKEHYQTTVIRRFAVLLLALACLPLGTWHAGAAASGTAVAWGNNSYGQATVPAAAAGDVIAIAGGDGHSVALKSDGTVVAWGSNFSGQTNVPAGLSGVTGVAAGWYSTLALKADGTVTAWGQVYDGVNYVPASVPVGLAEVRAISAGVGHTAALKNDGTVAVWGWNGFGQTNVPPGLSGVAAVAAGAAHTLALMSNGTVVAWGKNASGQVTGTSNTSMPFWDVAAPVTLGGQVLSGVTAVAAGEEISVAVKSDGSVVVWGSTGDGLTTVPAAAQSGVAKVAAGNHIAALKAGGTVVAWGRNNNGQTVVPAGLNGALAVSAGRFHTLSLMPTSPPAIVIPPTNQTVVMGTIVSLSVGASGSLPLVYQWRKDGTNILGATNASYNLGAAQPRHTGSYTVVLSNTAGAVTSAPPAVLTVNPVPAGRVIAWGRATSGATTVPAGLNSVIALAANGEHTLALNLDGSVVAWGLNDHGQTEVPPGLSGIVGVGAGFYHSLALRGDGTVVGWGENTAGQTTVPANLTNAAALAAGGYHSLALTADGAVVGWGLNDNGQVTIPASAQSGVMAIAAGSYHSVALKADGTVVVWGHALNGQTAVPAGLSNVVAIAAGYYNVLALKKDGTLVVWGLNADGQLNVPPNLGPVRAVAAGYIHSAVIKNDGTVVVWGGNNVGQLNIPPDITGAVAIAAAGVHTVVIVPPLPEITGMPAGQTFTLGASVTLGVNLAGLGYQWQFNGTNLAGANGPTLTLANLTPGNAGTYQVVITNFSGSPITSVPSTLLFFGDLQQYAGTILAGPVGQQFRVDYADVVVPGTTNWQVLTNLALPSSPFLLIDPNSAGKPRRFYRAVILP